MRWLSVRTRRVTVRTLKRLVAIVGTYSPLLTIIAMLLAFYELQVVHRSASGITNLLGTARKSAEEIEKLTGVVRQSAGDIESLSRSAATRYIGKFPDNMPDLLSLVEQTDDSLVIACDFAAYGNFSAYQDFDKYFGSLKKLLNEKKSVRIISYDVATRRIAREKQFGKDFERIKARSTYREFFRNHPGITEPTDLKGFLKFMEERDMKCRCDMLEVGIRLKEVSAELPIFFWIVDDGKRAALSFYAYGDDPREMSFQTVDAALISTLKAVASRIQWKDADKNLICGKEP